MSDAKHPHKIMNKIIFRYVTLAKKKKKKRKKKRKSRKSSRSKYFGAGYYPMHAGFYGDIASNAAGIGDGGGDGGGGGE